MYYFSFKFSSCLVVFCFTIFSGGTLLQQHHFSVMHYLYSEYKPILMKKKKKEKRIHKCATLTRASDNRQLRASLRRQDRQGKGVNRHIITRFLRSGLSEEERETNQQEIILATRDILSRSLVWDIVWKTSPATKEGKCIVQHRA